MKKLLFTRDSACLQPLGMLIEKQNHRTLAAWAIDCAPRVLAIFEARRPDDARPREALRAARAWARGEIKMPAAKKAAHAAHNAATDASGDPAACAAARAMGHVVGTVHVETHAMGLAMYGLTALAYDAGADGADAVVRAECDRLHARLLWWEKNADAEYPSWAPFLLREGVPNKELLLRLKQNGA
jgi:hypothetical protein